MSDICRDMNISKYQYFNNIFINQFSNPILITFLIHFPCEIHDI